MGLSGHLFISHASADKATADALCAGLEARGHKCWIAPRDIPAGADFPTAILDAIGAASAMVLVYSRHTPESEHVAREVERAVSKKIRVLPLRVGGAQPAGAFEYLLSTTQWVNLPASPDDKALAAINEALRRPVSRILPVHDHRAAIVAGLALAVVAAVALGWRATRPAPVLDKSVAVLPFANMSEEKANAYFADGIQDGILTALGRIRALKVISRTSTEQYRDKPHDLRSIAEALGVSVVLEGSVQRAGTRARINVQLIDARTDAHLWAESYDRDVTDAFAVQSDVVQQVAQAMKAALLPAESDALAVAPTQDAAAYDLYLQAGVLFRNADEQPRVVQSQAPKAIALYEQALALDPQFALAAAYMARAHMRMYFAYADPSPARLAAAKAAAERALALQPELGEGHLALGSYYYWGKRDYMHALEQFQLARQALPNDAAAVSLLAAVARRQGKWAEALRGFKEATALDPQSAAQWADVGRTYAITRRYAEAEQAFHHAVALALNPPVMRLTASEIYVMWKGDFGPERAALEALPPDSEESRAASIDRYQVQRWSRDYVAALKTLRTSPDSAFSDLWIRPLLTANLYRMTGKMALARPAYEQAQHLLEAAARERPGDPDVHTDLAYVYAGLDRPADAVAESKRAVELMPVEKDAVSGPGYLENLAEVYVAIGDHTRALELLQKLFAMPAGLTVSPAFLKLDPWFDPLRNDPRFEALLKAS